MEVGGVVRTRAWWYRVSAFDKARLVLAGFRPADRGDIIVAVVQKRSAPIVRFPPEVYRMDEETAGRIEDTRLTYRRV